jgi:hypothetical protein
MIPEMISDKYGKTIEIPFIPSGFRACLSQKDGKCMRYKAFPSLLGKQWEHIGRERAIIRKKPVLRIYTWTGKVIPTQKSVPEYIHGREMMPYIKKPVPHAMQKK